MPELPEVETVRSGLARFVIGRTIDDVEVLHPRAVRRHAPGGSHFAAALAGMTIAAVCRRGKYLWLPLASPDGVVDQCLVGHLGMSGQLLIEDADTTAEKHLRVRLRFTDGSELRFVDQRTFGVLHLDTLVPTPDVPAQQVPAEIVHIARDPFDEYFDETAFLARLRRRKSEVKRALLDQSLISGVGNIYADEALWRAKVSGLRPAPTLGRPNARRLLDAVREVLGDALRAGGTSFDALYVNVNGESGYFDRSLAVYGREGEPCPRCGTAIRRVPFMNRSSYFCPRCQRLPRAAKRSASRSSRQANDQF